MCKRRKTLASYLTRRSGLELWRSGEDLSIIVVSLISLASITLHFLFPHLVLAAAADKNRFLEFNLSEAIANSARQDKSHLVIPSGVAEGDTMVKSGQTPIEMQFLTGQIAAAAKPNSSTSFTINSERKVVYKKRVIITAYSSTPDQTDSTPFITASNTRVRDGIVAANFIPFGTQIKIPAIYGDKIFTVEDRMKSNKKVDIWFPTRKEALIFGAKIAEIEILETL
ncbi:3D domain-containing protein [Patescibacteria group bacterium]|nr:3D domain-containing protein [Patescibacteria group bacterium]MBU4000357.1 3D domain-containing protein [Patescibacteria group bacterium]MBU4056870.1 3D domain-containing protein [Patescibacteria group bacterium]MBU4368238.1 3D domain-containing protein [Patescibacteria group bacterium]